MNCQFYDRDITNKGSLVAHEISCKNNPLRKTHKRSMGAGQQRGSILHNKGKHTGRAVYWDDKYPLDTVLVEHSQYPRHCLKKRIVSTGLIEYMCALCGIGPEWYGKDKPLILDHINGVNNDNRIENLRFICNNCDSTLPTYKSRNRNKN